MASASAAFSLPDEDMNFTMKVYGLVTDGKIRLGIRNLDTRTNIPSQRWTLWDNFKLTYRAKNEEAIMSVLEVKIAEYETYVNNAISDDVINSVEQDAAAKVLDAADKALKSGTVDEKWDALIAVNDAYVHTQEHVAVVKEVVDALVALEEAVNTYTETASQEALDAADAIDEEYDNLTNEEIIALIDDINEVIAALRIPATNGADDEHPVNMTSVIVNPDIQQGATVGWKYTKNGGNGPDMPSETAGYEGKRSAEFYRDPATELKFNFWQEIANLPAGTYELTANASNSLNGAADAGNGGRAFLYAATYTAESDTTWFSSDPVALQEEGCVDAYNNYSVIFTLGEGELLTIGFKSSGVMDGRWFVCDDFTLKYFGTESAKEDSGNPMSVEGIEAADGVKVAAIYTVSGAPVATLQKGLNIVKYADGSVKKIFVK